MKVLVLSQNKYAFIDDEDYESVCLFKWEANKATGGKWYARRRYRVNKKIITQYLHSFILNTTSQIDHKDSNGLNCQKHNLRMSSQLQNMWNRGKQKNNTTGYKGVFLSKRDSTFCVRICVNRTRLSLSGFSDPIEAAKAYDKLARKYHGEFAKTNF